MDCSMAGRVPVLQRPPDELLPEAAGPQTDEEGQHIVHIDRSNGGRLGVDIDDSDGVALVIKRMGPGLMEDWNRTFPEADVRVDDRIVEVNCISGDVDRMFQECLTAQALTLKLQRLQVPEALACPTDAREVTVHVYDLWGCRYNWPRLLNSGSTRFGVFHTGVEVYGREWSFGATQCGHDKGVYAQPEPKSHPLHQYRRSVRMGPALLSREDLEELMPAIRQKWLGGSYDPWRRNCHHFTDFFCQILGFPSGPCFGICGAGDRSLAREIGCGPEGKRRCFPCSGTRGRWWRNSSDPLLDEASHSRSRPELPPAAAG